MNMYDTPNPYGVSLKGSRPWESRDAITDGRIAEAGRSHYKEDSPEDIERCLRCPYAECLDCLADTTEKRAGNRLIDTGMLPYLLELRKMDEKLCNEVCEKMGFNAVTVAKYEKRLRRESAWQKE